MGGRVMPRNAVHVLNAKPSIVWLDPSGIRNRMDASYFAAEFQELDAVLDRHDPSAIRELDALLKDPRRVMYMQTETFERADLPTGIPFISGVDVDDAAMSVRLERTKVVDPSMAKRYPKGILFDRAVLIKV